MTTARSRPRLCCVAARDHAVTPVRGGSGRPCRPEIQAAARRAPGSIARVLVVNTWHHIDDRARYARKLAQGLAPGGEIWIVDFTRESEQGPPPQYRLDATQVISELEDGGLHAELIEPEPLPRQYIVRARR